MLKAGLCMLVVGFLARPALAAEEYWVKYDYTTHTCSIIENEISDAAARERDAASANAPAKTTPTEQQNSSTTAQVTTDNTSNTGMDTSKSDDPTAALAAAWKKKEDAAREAHQDVTTALIGSPMKSRQDAEEEMQIMRKCGLHN